MTNRAKNCFNGFCVLSWFHQIHIAIIPHHLFVDFFFFFSNPCLVSPKLISHDLVPSRNERNRCLVFAPLNSNLAKRLRRKQRKRPTNPKRQTCFFLNDPLKVHLKNHQRNEKFLDSSIFSE